MTLSTCRLRFGAVAALLLLVVPVYGQWNDLPQADVHGHTMYTVFEPDLIPAIFEPQFIDVLKARTLYHPDEPLIVVRDGSEIHAYSLWHLEEHLVVNDHVNGQAITVTW